MNEPGWQMRSAEILSDHGFPTSGLEFLGAGEQSVCYGTVGIAILLHRETFDAELMGHVLPGEVSSNSYPALAWVTDRARDAGVRTPRILATGSDPQPYAVMERARGTVPAEHGDAVNWFGHLGVNVAKANNVATTGFGMFVPDGTGGYRGRYSGWSDFLERWLGAYLSVGRYADNDTRVMDLLLAQRIVTERDLALLAAKVRHAQRWPVTSVLTHYDNRLANILVDADEITVLDWGLSLAGIGVRQELVKLGETGPLSMANPHVAAFLHNYGLTDVECRDAIDDATLLLALDGIAMAHGWAQNPDRLPGIRAWLQTVKRVVSGARSLG